MIRDGWVCRACWKPNKAEENVCYRCKTPRDAQTDVAPGSKVETIDVMYSKRGRLDIEWPVLAYLVSWPLGFDGMLGLLGGFLGLAGGGLLAAGLEEGEVMGMSIGTFVTLLAFGSIILSALRLFVARSIQRFARWAYVVAIVLTALGSFPFLFGWLPSTYEPGSLSAQLQTFRVWVNLVMFFMAIALLVLSFVRRAEGAAAPERPAPAPVLAIPEEHRPTPALAQAPSRPAIEPTRGSVAFRRPTDEGPTA